MNPIFTSFLTALFAGLCLSQSSTPSGGLDTNSSAPVFHPLSNFDQQSLNLALYQDFLQSNLLHFGLANFSQQDFQQAGLNPSDQFLIEFMADQKAAQAVVLTNDIGPSNASVACNYSYPINSVGQFLDFSRQVTAFGEAGASGFVEHLNSRASAQLLLESVTIDAQQQLIFRQLQGLFAMPFWFSSAISQSMQWTLMAPLIVSCPANNTKVQFQNFPALNISNNPNISSVTNGTPAISTNASSLTTPNLSVNLTWDSPGKQVGPNNSYTTNATAGQAQFAAWISQLNTTFTPLTNVSGNSAVTQLPVVGIFGNNSVSAPLLNGTVFVVVTDSNLTVTSANISQLNSHIVAGPALFNAG